MHHPGEGRHHPEVEGMHLPELVVGSTPVGEGVHRGLVGNHLAVVVEDSTPEEVAALTENLKSIR